MERGGTTSDECDPLVVEFGDVAQVLTIEDGAVEVVAFLEEKIEALPFVLLKEADGDAGQEVRPAGNWRANYARGCLDEGGMSSWS